MVDFPRQCPPGSRSRPPSAEASAGRLLERGRRARVLPVGRLPAGKLIEAHQHLDACEDLPAITERGSARARDPPPTAPLDESEDLSWNTTFRPGTLVGQRYLIVQFIARAAAWARYMKRSIASLQERVALKTVTSTACDKPETRCGA